MVLCNRSGSQQIMTNIIDCLSTVSTSDDHKRNGEDNFVS
jgi:hypothetical protein